MFDNLKKLIHKINLKAFIASIWANKKSFPLLLINLIFSYGICWAVYGGEYPKFHDVILVWCIINFLWLCPILFYIFAIPLLIWILYSPVGIQYGYPNANMIASVLETNPVEIKAFWDARTIIYFVLIIIISGLIFYITKKITANTALRKLFATLSIITAFMMHNNIFPVPGYSFYDLGYSKMLGIFKYTAKQVDFVNANKKRMIAISQTPDQWKITQQENPKYKNYVLIIGESASKWYMSSYGYPVKTTPFLDQVKGVKYSNAISPSGYTIGSVPRLLTIPGPKGIEYSNSLITISKKLDMKTYWLSNEPRAQTFDNDISLIAKKSDEVFYLSPPRADRQPYDNELLPKFQQVLNQPSEHAKLIIIHIFGSHAQFCDRVDPKLPKFNFSNEYLNCYLSSLLQTDIFLKDIYQQLQATKQPFSMIYLSDHGLKADTLKHGLSSQENFQIPLFKISSDDQTQTVNDQIITGFGFIWFLTDWLNVQTQNQHDNQFISNYAATSPNNVKVVGANGITNYSEIKPFDNQLLKP